jgi:hypothetical protein
MLIPGALADRLDLEAAVGAAAPARGEFFPSRLEAEAALANSTEFASRLGARVRNGILFRPPEIVWVPRRDAGGRPVPDVAFAERVILEALTEALKDALAPYRGALSMRSMDEQVGSERSQFERAPLEDDGAVVVITDISSFYEYVDHALLEQDVVELAGDVDLATALRDALGEVTQREIGLPQGPRASDLLADLYLSAIDRSMARAGFRLHRLNDDFAFAATSRGDAASKLIALEDALRARGLTLNHAKTRVVDRATYEGWLQALDERLEGAAVAVAQPSFYGFDPVQFSQVEVGDDDPEVFEEAFVGALKDEEPDPYSVNHRLIERTLPVLAAAESTTPLELIETLIRDWEAHSRIVSLYLRSFIGSEWEGSMVQLVGGTLLHTSGDISSWTQGWLIDALARSQVPVSTHVVALLTSLLGMHSTPWFVRGRCAIALAHRQLLPPQEHIADLYELAPANARADLAAAVAIGDPSWAVAFKTGIAADPLLPRVFELAERAAAPAVEQQSLESTNTARADDEGGLFDEDIPF